MTKQTIIPAGYRLTVKTWENDMDNCQTVVLEGLTKEQVAFYVDFAKGFLHSTNYKDRICNLYEPDDHKRRQVANFSRQLFARHPYMLAEGFELKVEDLQDEDAACDCLVEMGDSLGITCSGDYYTRVVDNIKVEHVPVEVVLHDVTDQF